MGRLNEFTGDIELETDKPHKVINDDWIEQGSKLYNWSESNVAYCLAWWLNDDIKITPLVQALREQRPDPRGRKNVN